MKKMLKKKSKGFTLVELLIVIIIIGILAGMMMLSTGGATAKAEATKIVSDMRNMKAAAIMVYADSNAWPTHINSLDNYLDQKPGSLYKIESEFIMYNATSTDQKIKDSLKTMATTGGLPLYKCETTSADAKYDATGSLYMPIK
ncbi:MAG: prepilin-type N-terminal cleavage/methylation domain-containing protein [Clostridium sp.]|nr:prepilin-type N-terminal cleavage/methylation domain-containing protein [Clostridium sp.]